MKRCQKFLACNFHLYFRNVTSSYEIAATAVKLLRKVVSSAKWTTAKELMCVIKEVGKHMIESQPTESCVGNMIRKCK